MKKKLVERKGRLLAAQITQMHRNTRSADRDQPHRTSRSRFCYFRMLKLANPHNFTEVISVARSSTLRLKLSALENKCDLTISHPRKTFITLDVWLPLEYILSLTTTDKRVANAKTSPSISATRPTRFRLAAANAVASLVSYKTSSSHWNQIINSRSTKF